MKQLNNTVGLGESKFEITLDKEWQQGKVDYVMGFDPCEKEDVPINFYHKIRKFLKLPFKAVESSSFGVVYTIKNGIIYDARRI